MRSTGPDDSLARVMTDPKPETLLITLTGKDRPGVTSSVFAALSGAGVEVLDIEQIVLRGRLILGVLVTAPRNVRRVSDAVRETAQRLGMTVDVEGGVGDNKARGSGRSHVTVIGAPLRASAMAAVAGRIADAGANIDRIERMARYPVTAIDLHVSGADTGALRTVLAAEAARQAIDIAVQPATLLRRGTRGDGALHLGEQARVHHVAELQVGEAPGVLEAAPTRCRRLG